MFFLTGGTKSAQATAAQSKRPPVRIGELTVDNYLQMEGYRMIVIYGAEYR